MSSKGSGGLDVVQAIKSISTKSGIVAVQLTCRTTSSLSSSGRSSKRDATVTGAQSIESILQFANQVKVYRQITVLGCLR